MIKFGDTPPPPLPPPPPPKTRQTFVSLDMIIRISTSTLVNELARDWSPLQDVSRAGCSQSEVVSSTGFFIALKGCCVWTFILLLWWTRNGWWKAAPLASCLTLNSYNKSYHTIHIKNIATFKCITLQIVLCWLYAESCCCVGVKCGVVSNHRPKLVNVAQLQECLRFTGSA